MSMVVNSNLTKLKSFFSDRHGSQRTDTLRLLDQFVGHREHEDIQFIMLWGASNKAHATKADKDGLLYLFHFLKRVEHAYGLKVNLNLIFTDTHAHLNGYTKEYYERYITEISYHIRKHGYSFVRSSELSGRFARDMGYQGMMDYVEDIIQQPEERFGSWNMPVQVNNLVPFFAHYALKHCRRIASHESGLFFQNERLAALGYLTLAAFDKRVITETYHDHAFITYMSREESLVLPDLPVIRLYSIKSGLRTRPWFIND